MNKVLVCAYCGSTMCRVATHRRYCSNKCRQAAYRRRKKKSLQSSRSSRNVLVK